MPKYQVAIIDRPKDWTPECADDVPLDLAGHVEVLCESEDVFAAVDRAIEHNQSAQAARRGRWAVVIEPGGAGRFWPGARLCTPMTYKATAVDWPDGWEPRSPLDVPNCVSQPRGQNDGQGSNCAHAEAIVLGLNRQCIDHPGRVWHLVVATENEPTSRTVSYDSAGAETTTEVRVMHVIRPQGGGRGDCSHCPAGGSPCATADWRDEP